MQYVFAVAAFGATALLAWGVLSAIFSEERRVSRRLGELSAYEAAQASVAHPQLSPLSARVVSPAFAAIKREVSGLAPRSYRENLRRRLAIAGNPRGLDADRFVALKALIAVGVAAVSVAFAVFSRAAVSAWLIVLIVSVASYWLPDFWLSAVTDRRKRQIRVALPDVLDMLTIAVEAGLGFDQALSKIIRMAHGPLSREFARMLQEIQAGTDRGTALKRLTERADVPELNAFITAIAQAEQLGIPIANVLRVQAKEMRLTRRQRAEEQAQKTPVKVVFPLILCILPATLIIILGPAVVSIGHVFGAW